MWGDGIARDLFSRPEAEAHFVAAHLCVRPGLLVEVRSYKSRNRDSLVESPVEEWDFLLFAAGVK